MSKKVVLANEDFLSRMEVRRQPSTPRVGYEERQYRWRRIRSTCAQTIIANPSTLLYLKCRNSRVVARKTAELHAILCRIVDAIQELIDIVPQPAVAIENKSRGIIEGVLLDNNNLDLTNLRKVIAAELSAEVTTQVRAKRATTDMTREQLVALITEARTRLDALRKTANSLLLSTTVVRGVNSLAQEPALQKLHTTLAEPASTKKTLDVAKSMGVLATFDRSVSLTLLVSQEAHLPVSFTSAIRGNVLTTSVPMQLLGISAGDVVSSMGQEAAVLSVTNQQAQLSTSIPAGPIIVRNSEYTNFSLFKPLLEQISALRTSALSAPLNLENRPSAVEYCKRVVNLALQISALTRDALAAATQLSIDVGPNSSLLNDLYQLQFTFKEETRRDAEEMLRLLRQEGFVNAEAELSRGEYATLFTEDSREAASRAAISDSVLLMLKNEGSL
jgi:hypothetical protein